MRLKQVLLSAGIGLALLPSVVIYDFKLSENRPEAPRVCSGYPVIFSGKSYAVPLPEYRHKFQATGVTAISPASKPTGYLGIAGGLGYPMNNASDANCWTEAIRIRNGKSQKDSIRAGEILFVPDVPRR